MLQLISALTILSSGWTELPQIPISKFPAKRITGVAKKDDTWLVGTANGVYLGKPGGTWKQLTKNNIKAFYQQEEKTMALATNGRLDRFQLPFESVMFDVVGITGNRPWVNSVSISAKNQYWGLEGGYATKTLRGTQAFMIPSLKGVPVTAIAYRQSTYYLGTANGVYSAKAKLATKIPGLSEPVTALQQMADGVYVGFANTGLGAVVGGKLSRISSPVKAVRQLISWRSNLVVSSSEGAFVRENGKWNQLVKQECTGIIVLNDKLYICTPSGLRIFEDTGSH